VRALLWSTRFVRAYRKATRRQPELAAAMQQTLERLAAEPFDAALHTHKLKGKLAEAWACSVDYDHRILFDFVRDPETGRDAILLLTMGTHDEVY